MYKRQLALAHVSNIPTSEALSVPLVRDGRYERQRPPSNALIENAPALRWGLRFGFSRLGTSDKVLALYGR